MHLTRLADYLRAEGLRVVEHAGWQTRGRPSGGFRPVGVLWHHTAVRSDRGNPAPSVNLVTNGRSDLAGPLCQLLPAWDGIVHVIAAGRANHAGVADGTGTGPIPAGDGNTLMVGLEIDYHPDYQDGPSPAQYRAAIAAAAAVLRYLHDLGHIGTPRGERCRGHYETSRTGKWDPGRLGRRSIPLGPWRADVDAALARPAGAWYRNDLEDDVTPEDRKAIADDVVARLAPVIEGARVAAWNATQQAAGAATWAARAAEAVAAGDAAAAAAAAAQLDAIAALSRALDDAVARAPRINTRRYDTPGVPTYDAMADGASSYIDLSGQLAPVSAVAVVDMAAVEAAAARGAAAVQPTHGTLTLER